MPTTITHAVLACAAAEAFKGREKRERWWAAALAVSMLPDADALGFAIGVPYEHFLGHRGFFHSPFFALVLSAACMFAFFRDLRPLRTDWWKVFAFLFVLGASHGVLDAFTDGGLGIALLAPFDNNRYFFPWTPIPVAPIGLKHFLTGWGLQVLIWEATHLWVPVLATLSGWLLIRRRQDRVL